MEKYKKINIPYFTLIEAPHGYGKTFYINKLLENKKLDTYSISGSEIYFDLKKLETFINKKDNHVLTLDNINLFINYNEIVDFLENLILKPLKNIKIIVSSNKKTNLSFEKLDNNCIYLDINLLKITEDDYKALFKENNLRVEKTDLDFLTETEGWNLAIDLYIKLKKGNISYRFFNELLAKSIKKTLTNELTYKNKDDYFIDFLPKIFKNDIDTLFIEDEFYWEESALKEKDLIHSILLIDKSINICNNNLLEKGANILNFITRKIYFLSLIGDYLEIDNCLELGEKHLENSKDKDKIAFLYQKANRQRFLCNHEKVFEIIEQINSFKSIEKEIINLQNKTYILEGLTHYQKGDYDKTRESYNKAILLADNLFNVNLSNEIKIMLAFLDVWEGKTSNINSEEIFNIIEYSHEKKQPLMFLNFAFYLILGEKLDIEKGIEIINKTKEISKKLGYKYLLPLIYDIEARIYRYSKDYEKALYCHKKALELIPENSFDYFQASLNQCLTFIRSNFKEKGQEQFEKLLIKTKENNIIGLYNQIDVLLKELKNEKIEVHNQNKININENSLYTIKINTFGKFQVFVNDKEIYEWKRKKTKKLFAYLITNQRGIHRESLAEMLFSSEITENPLKNLDVNIHSLRKTLEPERKNKASSVIMFKDSCYLFNWSYTFSFDFIELEKNYLLWKKEKNEDKKITFSNKIIELYKGTFLEELDFADDWLEQREDFLKKFLDISHWLANLFIDKSEYEEAEIILNNILKFEKINEIAFILLLETAEQKKDFDLLKKTYAKAENNFKKINDSLPTNEITATFKKIYSKFNLKI